jgi:predicted DNA-binding transcriptional regulator AlpA
LQQLAEHTGYSMSELKEVMKADLSDWPHVERFGRMVAVSEADVDTAVEAAAIEWCHMRAAELGVVLREGT